MYDGWVTTLIMSIKNEDNLRASVFVDLKPRVGG